MPWLSGNLDHTKLCKLHPYLMNVQTHTFIEEVEVRGAGIISVVQGPKYKCCSYLKHWAGLQAVHALLPAGLFYSTLKVIWSCFTVLVEIKKNHLRFKMIAPRCHCKAKPTRSMSSPELRMHSYVIVPWHGPRWIWIRFRQSKGNKRSKKLIWINLTFKICGKRWGL